MPRMARALRIFACSMILSSAAPASAQTVSSQEAYEIAKEAYVYAYPLILSDVFMRQATNYPEPTGIVTQAPYNQFSHSKAFPPADFKAVVRANVDTLYSSANLDLGSEPVVLSIPASNRYFMMPLLSLWSDVFAVPGTRTTGRNVAHYTSRRTRPAARRTRTGYLSQRHRSHCSCASIRRNRNSWGGGGRRLPFGGSAATTGRLASNRETRIGMDFS
jgi:Protein of unknown function (DUF1254)